MSVNKQRNTRQRQEVLDAVMNRCDHPSADEIYLDVRRNDDKISRGTVYRNLKILEEDGKINHVRLPGTDRYDKTLSSHYHIICTECGKLIDAPIDYYSDFDAAAEKMTGYIIGRHRMQFEGICPDCQNKQKNEEEQNG